MTGRVAGKVAFITGAARGQGRSHALRLAEEGADIIAIDICGAIPSAPYPAATPEDLAETVRSVEALGRRIVASQVDVRDAAAMTEAANAGVQELGRLDIVAANAGIASYSPSTLDIDPEGWSEMLDINLTGVWHTARATVPHLIATGGGSMILTSSSAGLRAFQGIGHYVASKHAVVGLMKSLALELGPQNIRVNSVHPAGVDTPMIQNDATYRLFSPDHPNPNRETFAEVSQAMNVLPVPWVEPHDISNALLFLASDEARYITGATLPVDAGIVIK
ncbi:MAG: (+)-trans-carveol dehydrogenase [Solirubrobacteraceae bacterium]|nr:(+)-trans-carveol dehydrogenase [Solirubrobacteraceae bacterium]